MNKLLCKVSMLCYYFMTFQVLPRVKILKHFFLVFIFVISLVYNVKQLFCQVHKKFYNLNCHFKINPKFKQINKILFNNEEYKFKIKNDKIYSLIFYDHPKWTTFSEYGIIHFLWHIPTSFYNIQVRSMAWPIFEMHNALFI